MAGANCIYVSCWTTCKSRKVAIFQRLDVIFVERNELLHKISWIGQISGALKNIYLSHKNVPLDQKRTSKWDTVKQDKLLRTFLWATETFFGTPDIVKEIENSMTFNLKSFETFVGCVRPNTLGYSAGRLVHSSVLPSVLPSCHPSVRPFVCLSVRPFVRPSIH